MSTVEWNGVPSVSISSAAGATAVLPLFGAHLVSWQPSGPDSEVIFVSSEAILGGGEAGDKATRGGTPVCWPQFAGLGDLPSHGLARNRLWSLRDDAEGRVVLELEDNEETRAIWPHAFCLRLTADLTEDGSLRLGLQVTNNDADGAIEFTTALHTYFSVGAIEQTCVEGFQGLTYIDKMRDNGRFVDERPEATIAEETDRIYLGTGVTTIHDRSGKRTIAVNPDGFFSDSVLWNPWVEKSAAIGDLGDGEFHGFVCVESGAVGSPVSLEAGATAEASVTYHVGAAVDEPV